MCCVRCLKILICIAAALISTNGEDPENDQRLSNDDRMKLRELDYGERLSSMEENPREGLRGELDRQGAPPGPVRLIGTLNDSKKKLNQEKNEQAKSTKCTTNKAIEVDLKGEIKDSDENSPIPNDVTDSNTITDDTTGSSDYTTPSGDETGDDVTGTGGDDSSITYPSISTTERGENEVDPDDGPPQDPSKDDDYDATVSTKKYYGAHAVFNPDHYLDDA